MRKPRIYPVHQCCSCHRQTTNKSYCDICLKLYMRVPYDSFTSIYITADIAPAPLRRRHESEIIRGME